MVGCALQAKLVVAGFPSSVVVVSSKAYNDGMNINTHYSGVTREKDEKKAEKSRRVNRKFLVPV